MFRATLFFIFVCLVTGTSLKAYDRGLSYPAVSSEAVQNRLLAKSVLLYDASAHRIVYERNSDEALPPASTTKLMTAILVYELKGLNGSLVVDRADTLVEPSHVPLIPGEIVSINQLMHSLLIASDNDSAMALARYTGGSVPAFVQMMNQRAEMLGCTRTHFINPNGLPASHEYTTSHDLLLIFQKALSIPVLRQILETKNYSLVTAHGPQILKNHNKLLGKYPGMGPAKTGWTLASRHTYAASATRDGHELQLIILNSPDKWKDATLLLDYGVANLAPLPAPPELQPASTPIPTAVPIAHQTAP